MKNIISASRRTDIPAFYTDWFINRLDKGHIHVKNPYSGKVYFVSLKPQDIHSIVFWSKDFSPLIRKIEQVERVTKNLFFHFTLTAVPKTLEPCTPDFASAARDLIFLSKRFSPGQIIWRFDPIVLTEKIPFEYYEEAFAKYAEALKGASNECCMSFAEPYKKALNNFKRYSDDTLIDVARDKKKGYAERLSAIAERNGFRLFACCNDLLLTERVLKASCINGERLSRLFNDYSVDTRPAPTRKGCACTRSIDIGSYDTCPHGCLYCYANSDKEKAVEFLKNHNPEWSGLGFEGEEEIFPLLEEKK